MGITVLDHLIIGRKRYFSLREEGLMEESKLLSCKKMKQVYNYIVILFGNRS